MKHKFFITGLFLFFSFLNSYSKEELPRSEYPRPQFKRDCWVNLNGTWDFQIDASNVGIEKKYYSNTSFDNEIIVPFCPESKLSGIENKDFMNNVWYQRIIEIPSDWKDKMILLNFGAVYYNCEVFIDGVFVNRHFGGNSSFSIDITKFVLPGNKHNLVVRATSDLRSGHQLAGKQSLRADSYGCAYTRTTGIWQTVWMEAVSKYGLKGMQIITDIDQQILALRPNFYSLNNQNIKITLKDGNKKIGIKTVKASDNALIVFPIKNMKLWSPETPYLYDLEYEVLDSDGNLIDNVFSYAGMRKIHIEGNKIYLNNSPYYQRLVLDQGFYPDGIWTAPTDEALKNDILLSKAAGFNGARLHQKVFEERFYYWADKLGYITWGEAPSWGMDANDPIVGRNFLEEWTEILLRDRNHPSLIVWTPLNEEWNPDRYEYPRFVNDIYKLTKAIDPTRPVNGVSGGTHVVTDIWSVHTYEQTPDSLKKQLYSDGKYFQTPNYTMGNRKLNSGFNEISETKFFDFPIYTGGIPYILDEFGGIKWVDPNRRDNNSDAWGYGSAPATEEEFFERLSGLVKVLHVPFRLFFCDRPGVHSIGKFFSSDVIDKLSFENLPLSFLYFSFKLFVFISIHPLRSFIV